MWESTPYRDSFGVSRIGPFHPQKIKHVQKSLHETEQFVIRMVSRPYCKGQELMQKYNAGFFFSSTDLCVQWCVNGHILQRMAGMIVSGN